MLDGQTDIDQAPPSVGVFLIPIDPHYFYSLRVDEIWVEESGYRLACTRCDISPGREPVLRRMRPNSVVMVKSDGPGQWVQARAIWPEGPLRFREWGQPELF